MTKKAPKFLKWRKDLLLPCFILFISLVMLNTLDVVSTKLFLAKGIPEANPLFQNLNNGITSSDLGLLLIKLFIIPILCLAMIYPSLFDFRVLFIVNIVYIVVVLNNILTLIV